MYDTYLILLLILAAGVRSNNDCELNLETIFQTPKDFSRVNFDHFEILERNNFENPISPTTSLDNNVEVKPYPPNSIANAQVMVRFGGDDFRDCSRIYQPPKLVDKVYNGGMIYSLPSLQPVSNIPVQESLNNLAASPFNSYQFQSHPKTFQCPNTYYSQSPSIPSNYMNNFYYLLSLLRNSPYSNYQWSNHQPSQLNYVKEKSSSNLILDTSEKDNILENPSQRNLAHYTENQNFRNLLEYATLRQEKDQVRNYLDDAEDYEIEEDFSNYLENPKSFTSTEDIFDEEETAPEDITIETIETTSPNPNPSESNIKLVEVNIGNSTDKTDCKDVIKEIEEIMETGTLEGLEEEKIIASECPCHPNSICDCCNRERNPNIPYGKRFSTDVDSLFKVKKPVINFRIPVEYLTKKLDTHPHRLHSDGQVFCNPNTEIPKSYLGGCKTIGSAYYSDPYKSLIYREPILTASEFIEQQKEPHIYKVVPKYDIIPREIKSLKIPDLVPTNNYLCANCNNAIPHKDICNRQYTTTESNQWFPQWSVLNNRVPSASNYVSSRYCPNCAKYRGEMNEFTDTIY